MAEYDVVEQAELRGLAQWLAGWTWPLTEAASIERATSFGWTVVDEDPGRGELFGTGLLTERSFATSTLNDSAELLEITIYTSSVVDVDLPDDRNYVDEAFSAQVRVVGEILGDPVSRDDGVDGSVKWHLGSGATLRVERTDSNCSWTVDSPYLVELKRHVTQLEDEDDDDD